MGGSPSSRAASCARPPAGTESQSCSEVIWKRDISLHLSGVIKCEGYFHLQQGLWHCCGQVPKLSVPHRKGRMAILSCFCKVLGARQLRAGRALPFTTVLQTQAVAEQEEPTLLCCSLRHLFLPATGLWRCPGRWERVTSQELDAEGPRPCRGNQKF